MGWSLNATNIVTQKYFRGTPGTPEREHSLRQVIDRVANTISDWGIEGGYFADTERSRSIPRRTEVHLGYAARSIQLTSVVQHWCAGCSTTGKRLLHPCHRRHHGRHLELVPRRRNHLQGRFGCRYQLVQHSFKCRTLEGWRHSLWPMSASCAVPTHQQEPSSRAAKHVAQQRWLCLNVDHPDVEEFIWCKTREEQKARALRDAGFDMDLDGKDSFSVQYQNANNSVRVTDEFMHAVKEDRDWTFQCS